jgi:hypothetical protein
MRRRGDRSSTRWLALVTTIIGAVTGVVAAIALAPLIPMTFEEDFHTAGTQVEQLGPDVILTSDRCVSCHGGFDEENEPYATWSGSGGRIPMTQVMESWT